MGPENMMGSLQKRNIPIKPAPVVLIGYNRPQHIERCISSLRANDEARDTILYAFLDGPRSFEDAPLVEEVRGIAQAATGFLEVRIVQRETNLGLSRNVIDSVTRVLAEHESVIVIEDDLVVSPTFLRYMREAFELYQFSAGVFSIGGYNYPRTILPLPKSYSYDAFFVMRHMCWGWGTWRDRWQKADWEIRHHVSVSKNSSWKRSFSEGGVDLPRMLEAQVRGHLDSWAIRWTYAHFTNHAVCLVPVQSLVNNMGIDGSARYFHRTLNRNPVMRFPPHVYVDPLIARMFKTAERRSFAFRAGRKLYRTLQHTYRYIFRTACDEYLCPDLQTVGKAGAAAASPEEISEHFRARDTRTSAVEKIVDLSTAKSVVERWRGSHKTVCFTNGCFDLLHFGHISSFLQAKQHADKLIVGINTDSSVKKYKGPLRPIQDERTRSAIVASLEYVDLVIKFDDLSAIELVKQLKPDVIAKEGYEIDAWPEAQYVRSYGGRVVFLKREEGYSTTELVKRINTLEK